MLDKRIDEELLQATIKRAKEQGMRVFLNKAGSCSVEGTWGIISNGSLVLYFQEDYFGGLSFSIKYKPNRKTGSGRQVLDRVFHPEKVDFVQLFQRIEENRSGFQEHLWTLEEFLKYEEQWSGYLEV